MHDILIEIVIMTLPIPEKMESDGGKATFVTYFVTSKRNLAYSIHVLVGIPTT